MVEQPEGSSQEFHCADCGHEIGRHPLFTADGWHCSGEHVHEHCNCVVTQQVMLSAALAAANERAARAEKRVKELEEFKQWTMTRRG